jgi:hypothetical protein
MHRKSQLFGAGKGDDPKSMKSGKRIEGYETGDDQIRSSSYGQLAGNKVWGKERGGVEV